MTSPVQLKIVELALTKFPDNGHDSITAIISDFLVSDTRYSSFQSYRVESSWIYGTVGFGMDEKSPRHGTQSMDSKLLQSEKDYYKWEFSLALVQAIRRADVKMVEWILTHFSNCIIHVQ
ncbi:LOW QUALITY PROTEIN: hypothetical protein PHMEG_00037238 [Phytophthora megakarya]|uniref:Uncharacterized protein n=1 Tax=Phytophthora megakarya TaxID=4795 RepID=A0A225UJI9_9STRA|nr:LOW QUALITY PROTEIN: hypothetical protein PHMEG_00037238 [Phytophthora megakarya]